MVIQKFVNTDNDSLVGGLIRLPLRLLPQRAKLRIRRGPAQGMRWIVGSGTHGCWLGTYEWGVQERLQDIVEPGWTVWDVGAQAGFFSMVLSQLVGQEGSVVAVEPFPDNLQNLLTHQRLNEISNLQILACALSDAARQQRFTVELGPYQNRLTSDSGNWGFYVATQTVDGLVADGLSPPDLMKVDVEGAESAVINGAEETLREHKPQVLVEVHNEVSLQACTTKLESLDYILRDEGGDFPRILHGKSG